MTSALQQLLTAFETHSIAGIEAALDAGAELDRPVNGKLPIHYLIEMYFRSDAFTDCLRLVLDRGAVIDDSLLRAVLLNDTAELDAAALTRPDLLSLRVSLVCAFTPLIGASLLHVAAEYGHLEVARRLIELGADVDLRADVDDNGFNGQTPLFHTVNSHENRSAPVMQLLLDAGARTDVHLAGITWGAGFEWATVCFDVTPVSYAQFGLLRQMQRSEEPIYRNVRALLAAAGRKLPTDLNVSNKYLAS